MPHTKAGITQHQFKKDMNDDDDDIVEIIDGVQVFDCFQYL